MLKKQEKRNRRHKRIRAKIFGTATVPRVYVFRSGKHIYAQLIDDENSKIIASASDLKTKEDGKIKAEKKQDKSSSAKEVGKLIAKKAKDLKIEKIVFDRAGYKYHGRVKALAEAAREGGLKF